MKLSAPLHIHLCAGYSLLHCLPSFFLSEHCQKNLNHLFRIFLHENKVKVNIVLGRFSLYEEKSYYLRKCQYPALGGFCGDKMKCFSEIGDACAALKSALNLHLCGKLGRRGGLKCYFPSLTPLTVFFLLLCLWFESDLFLLHGKQAQICAQGACAGGLLSSSSPLIV